MFEASIIGSEETPAQSAKVAFELAQSEHSRFQAIHSDAQRNLSLAIKLLELRKTREEVIGAGLFSDPAWDILLTLYVSKIQQVRLKQTCVIDESGVPATTVFRWLNSLEERGFIWRSNHPTDARSNLVELSDAAAAKMTILLNASFTSLYEI